jgi:hypothetical protein
MAVDNDIIFFSLAGPAVGDYTGAHTVIFQGFLSVVQWQDIRMYVYFKWKYAHGSPSLGLKSSLLFLTKFRGVFSVYH